MTKLKFLFAPFYYFLGIASFVASTIFGDVRLVVATIGKWKSRFFGTLSLFRELGNCFTVSGSFTFTLRTGLSTPSNSFSLIGEFN